MGLEQFMGDLGVESEEPEPSEEGDDGSAEPDYTYNGDKELLDITLDTIQSVLDETEYNFEEDSLPAKGSTLTVTSPGGEYVMVVAHNDKRADRDCILVKVTDSDTGYDVMEPYPVYLVEGWREELKQAINTIEDKQDELVFCDRCGGVMIIRTTNMKKERIRGCSNYPNCRNKEVLSDGT